MRVRGEPAHIGPDLGDDDVGAEVIDPGMVISCLTASRKQERPASTSRCEILSPSTMRTHATHRLLVHVQTGTARIHHFHASLSQWCRRRGVLPKGIL